MLQPYLEAIRRENPRIHCITNGVSASLCANGLIALGASPMMAEDPQEVEEIVTHSQGLCLNLGMPNPGKLSAMALAGGKANQQGIPVVFDPVGVGASGLRRQGAQMLMEAVSFDAIRGNLWELKCLSGELGHSWGVDAPEVVTQATLPQVVDFAKGFSQKTGAVVILSSAIDVVAKGNTAYVAYNGHPMLTQVSGSGCLLSAMVAAYLAANPYGPQNACLSAVCTMGVCGQMGAKKALGNGSFAVELLDSISNLDGNMLDQEARYEVF